MSNTKFIKVDVSERLPNEAGEYNTEIGTVLFSKKLERFLSAIQVDWWIDEVPDRESELIEMLEECKILLKIGCDPSEVNFEKIESLIQSVKQPN